MQPPLRLPRRYLVGFDPRELPHHFTDVLVIGGGLAGLRVALGMPLSQQDIANRVGASLRGVARAMALLRGRDAVMEAASKLSKILG